MSLAPNWMTVALRQRRLPIEAGYTYSIGENEDEERDD